MARADANGARVSISGAGEPFPRHWRTFPEPWAITDPSDPAVRDALAAAIEELPATWREVVIARDGLGRDPGEVGERLGLTPSSNGRS